MIRKPQPLPIRLTHWISVVVISIMTASGLQILAAYPYFGPQGEHVSWMVQNVVAPSWLRVGGGLAGARHIHFAFAWFLLANALAYLIYLFGSGEWRRRLFWPPRDAKPALIQTLVYLDQGRYATAWLVRTIVRAKSPRPARAEPPHGLYNGLQRAAYTVAILLGVAMVGSGLAMWKPVQLHRLAWLFGGYDGARLVHFLSLVALGLFLVGHIVMVALHWRAFPKIFTGGTPRPEEKS